MSLTRNFHQDASMGLVDGVRAVHVFGRTPGTVNAGVLEDIWDFGGVKTWPQAAATATISSTAATDDKDSTGARKVLIEGLDANWDVQSVEYELEGTADVTTTETWIRYNKMRVTEAGSYGDSTGPNDGTITLTHDDDDSEQLVILFASGMGFGESLSSHYSVPNGEEAYIQNINHNVDAAKSGTVILYTREDADQVVAPFGAANMMYCEDIIIGAVPLSIKVPINRRRDETVAKGIPQKTDIWAAVIPGANTTPADVEYDMILRKL